MLLALDVGAGALLFRLRSVRILKRCVVAFVYFRVFRFLALLFNLFNLEARFFFIFHSFVCTLHVYTVSLQEYSVLRSLLVK